MSPERLTESGTKLGNSKINVCTTFSKYNFSVNIPKTEPDAEMLQECFQMLYKIFRTPTKPKPVASTYSNVQKTFC